MTPETWDGDGHEPGDTVPDVTWVSVCKVCGRPVEHTDNGEWVHS